MVSQEQLDERRNKPQSDRPDELSRDGALLSLLMREDLSDVTLRASDGTLVIANRCILASRSPVFWGMLYGPFKEASNTVVDIGCEGKVLRAIVNYIYTDKLSACPTNTNSQEEKADTGDENDTSWEADTMKLMRFLVALMDASEYFALSGLRRMTESSAMQLILANGKLAIFFMAACAPDCGATINLRDTALVLVKKSPSILIDGTKSVVAMIHPLYMEEILKQERLPMNEFSCFQILYAWATAEVADSDGDKKVSITASNPAPNDWENNRTHVASEMSRHIHLENISPTDLSTVVAASGLVSIDRLFDAYKTQALRSEKSGKQMRRSYEQCRGAYVWMYSGTNTVIAQSGQNPFVQDVLDCPVMKTGVHKWRIQVGQAKGHGFGVIGTCPTDNSLLRSDLDAYCKRKVGWTLCEGFAIKCRNDDDEPQLSDCPSFKIRAGSIVSFSLDLDRGGILTVSIDGDAPFEVFSGMCKGLGEEDGFLPKVYVKDGTVEFLGFEEDEVYF
jgi:hypothetical protein